MSLSVVSFNVGLYEEHLEEAAFLYEQRQALLVNPEISWAEIGEFEERLEAHIDALIVGGELALQIVRERMKGGGPGELYAALALFCRYRNATLLAEALRTLDFTDKARVRALEEALKQELPAEWTSFCEHALQRRDQKLAPILAAVCGFRRMPLGNQIHALIANAAPEQVSSSLLHALSRLPTDGALQTLWFWLKHPDPQVRSAALLALLRTDPRNVVPHCLGIVSRESWPCIGLGLGGDRSAVGALRQLVDDGAATADHLLALGLLGDTSVVRTLLNALANEPLAAAAARSLHMITGAPLFEEEFIPDPIRKDELLPHELEAWNTRKELPARPDGEPFGTKTTRLSVDPVAWDEWLKQHAASFRNDQRYRKGKPCSPLVLLEELAAERSSPLLRQLAYEELAIRYGCHISFEADMLATWQLRALAEMRGWVESQGTPFTPGRWYLAGRLIE
jgi:uncharacterized protein (TIGR02270 family)